MFNVSRTESIVSFFQVPNYLAHPWRVVKLYYIILLDWLGLVRGFLNQCSAEIRDYCGISNKGQKNWIKLKSVSIIITATMENGKRLAIFIVFKVSRQLHQYSDKVLYRYTRHQQSGNIYDYRGAPVVKDKLLLLGVPFKNAVKSRSQTAAALSNENTLESSTFMTNARFHIFAVNTSNIFTEYYRNNVLARLIPK